VFPGSNSIVIRRLVALLGYNSPILSLEDSQCLIRGHVRNGGAANNDYFWDPSLSTLSGLQLGCKQTLNLREPVPMTLSLGLSVCKVVHGGLPGIVSGALVSVHVRALSSRT
jgi:hypothetical protein